MKVKIKVTYKGSIDTNVDVEIIKKIESIGGKWYAQGKGIESDIRDICFDLEIEQCEDNIVKVFK